MRNETSMCFDAAKAITPPRGKVSADKKLKKSAFRVDHPPCLNTAKSPSSCGISWAAAAIQAEIPREVLSTKLAPTNKPPRKLCTASAIMIK
mmetsp:Transcript_2743/g.5126  ORF Transcript_2743/g.5126 Transcript_2743/m.5126 type:complete len:92 (-) Transcript_2743:2582-2857(-)